LENENK